MIYRVELTFRAEKEFSKLERTIQVFLFAKFQRLEKSVNPLANAAKLVGFKDIYRHRFGDYRILFTVEKDGTVVILLVLKVAHRKEIYNSP